MERHEVNSENTQTQLRIVDKQGLRYTFKNLLADKGMTQSDLAWNVGIDKAYISRIVNGKEIPPAHTRTKICKELDAEESKIWRLEFLAPKMEGEQ